ncbi:hypothetical protein MAP00_003016 [Monascus purpureus]|nr:hypothetical protein MAP00_003016 [Monascus purpureus]
MDDTMEFTNSWADFARSDSTEVATEPEDQNQLGGRASAAEVIHIEDDRTPGRRGSPEHDGSRPVTSSRPQLRGTRKRDFQLPRIRNYDAQCHTRTSAKATETCDSESC